MNNKKNENFFVWTIKNAIYPSVVMGGIMAVICLIACRDDPNTKKKNPINVLNQ